MLMEPGKTLINDFIFLVHVWLRHKDYSPFTLLDFEPMYGTFHASDTLILINSLKC